MSNLNTKIRPLYKLTQLFVSSLFKIVFGLKVVDAERVPATGAFILASNHQSWFDPPIVGSTCPREIYFAAKRELFKIPILGRMIRYYNSIPVKRSGYDRAVLDALNSRLSNGNVTIIFPEGTRYLDGKLHPPKSGIGMVALRADVPILPVYVNGSAYIFKQIFKRDLSITFGKPFTLEEIGMNNAKGKEAYKAISVHVMHRIASVGQVAPPES